MKIIGTVKNENTGIIHAANWHGMPACRTDNGKLSCLINIGQWKLTGEITCKSCLKMKDVKQHLSIGDKNDRRRVYDHH